MDRIEFEGAQPCEIAGVQPSHTGYCAMCNSVTHAVRPLCCALMFALRWNAASGGNLPAMIERQGQRLRYCYETPVAAYGMFLQDRSQTVRVNLAVLAKPLTSTQARRDWPSHGEGFLLMSDISAARFGRPSAG